ncbi:MAG: hypothetical protein Hyperionvirus20_11 [Hyperionvirus sp.]|uniref:Uncharacterized protein n=1 Tax=Hyperionvirus sp. TaxID=2487770 RepID=A0A3G5AEC8_9VIRU|nr:MAG: hypothetical protein Hyperionvirus20_11 [Hyperionvirus sp.]
MKDNSKNKNTEKIFRDLVSKQLRNIPTNKKLQLSDIKRIARRINGSVSDPNKCAIWSGYITNINNASKGTYVNFYFRKKKVALHRLLYINFIGDLEDDEYLKFNCENKGKCCNVHHMNKFKYNTVDQNKDVEGGVNEGVNEKAEKKLVAGKNKSHNSKTDMASLDSDDLMLTFD